MAPETNRAHFTARHSGEPHGYVHRPTLGWAPRVRSPSGRPGQLPGSARTYATCAALKSAHAWAGRRVRHRPAPGAARVRDRRCARVGPRVRRPGRPEGTHPGAARARYGPAPGAARTYATCVVPGSARAWAGQRVRHRAVARGGPRMGGSQVRHRPAPGTARVRHRRVCPGRPTRVPSGARVGPRAHRLVLEARPGSASPSARGGPRISSPGTTAGFYRRFGQGRPTLPTNPLAGRSIAVTGAVKSVHSRSFPRMDPTFRPSFPSRWQSASRQPRVPASWWAATCPSVPM